jgi:4-amino-4-deoxy-L-arabinose transferase-like glycosyltransferase
MNRPMHSALPWRASLASARWGVATQSLVYRLSLSALTCAAFALRLVLLNTFPFREDEAIYGYWARVATVDPFFLDVWPDKPPIFIWLLTGAFALFGPSEASARLVSIFASVLTIPVVALGAQRLWSSQKAALLAALLLTVNPFAVSFAPTAYTDSMLVFFGTGALVAALGGRGLIAGLLLAAACMTKQQGLFYVPLVIALLFTASSGEGVNRSRHVWGKFAWALLGTAIITLPILWWDSQRWAVAPSPWDWAQVNYAPLRLLPPDQWLGRGLAWGELLWYLGGSWTVWPALGLALTVATVMAARIVRERLPLALLLGWGLCFLLVHLVTTIQVWDRYLLPLAPWLVLVVSGPMTLVTHWRQPSWCRGLLFVLLVLSLCESVLPGLAAARGEFPIGGDHGDYAGLTQAIAWVQQCPSPEADAIRLDNNARSSGLAGDAGDGKVLGRRDCPAILYHQVLGWHFRFYLYDDLLPQGENPPRFDLRWFPSAAYLADNAAKSPYPPKYLIVPEWATPRDLALHLAMRGLALEPRLQVGRFAVMEITQPPRPSCDWCKSSVPTAPFLAPFAEQPNPQMSMP